MKGKISGPKYCENQMFSNATENISDATQENESTFNDKLTNEQMNDISPRICFETDVNFAGFGISDNKIPNVQSPDDCQIQCEKRLDCMFWTLSQNICWLKSSDEGRRVQNGKISGPKSCLQKSESDIIESSTILEDYLLIQEDDDVINEIASEDPEQEGLDNPGKETPLFVESCFVQDMAIRGFGLPDNQVNFFVIQLYLSRKAYGLILNRSETSRVQRTVRQSADRGRIVAIGPGTQASSRPSPTPATSSHLTWCR